MKRISTLLFLSLFLAACAGDKNAPGVAPLATTDEDASAPTGSSEPVLPQRTVYLGEAKLVGELGEYQVELVPAPQVSARPLSNGTEIEIDGGDDFAIMSRFFFRGGLLHEDLQVGAHVELGPRNWNAPPDVLQVGLMGCSGPARRAWTYDGVASHITIDVDQGAGADDRVLHFVSTFRYDDREQTLEGDFGYTVR